MKKVFSMSRQFKYQMAGLILVGLLGVPLQAMAADADNDGVPDAVDEFDADASKVIDIVNASSLLGNVTSIANLKLWYDASNNNYSENSGGAVSRWYDLSGGQHHATQSTGSAQPQIAASSFNGLPALQFDGSSSFMDFDGSFLVGSEMTVFVVASTAGSANYPIAGDGISGANRMLILGRLNSSRAVFGYDASSNVIVPNVALAGSGPELFTALGTSSDKTLFVNGKSVGATGHSQSLAGYPDATLGRLRSGSSSYQFLDGKIAEILIFDTALSQADRIRVNGYLSNKWDLDIDIDEDGDVNSADSDDDGDSVPDNIDSQAYNADVAPATVTLSVSNTSIGEDGGSSNITATLSASADSDVTVTLSFSGTATSGTDYSTPSASITIPAGQTSASAIIGIAASGDTTYEGNETVIIDIAAVTNAIESGTQQQTVTITDAESPPVATLSIGSASISEDGGSSTITATLNHASFQPTTVNLAYSGTATSGTDYGTPSSSITIAAGQTTASAVTGITATGDAIYEGDETVIIDIASVTNGSENGTQQQTVTIDDAENVPAVSLSASSSAIAEAAGVSTLTATLSVATTEAVTVSLAFSGTATGGADYNAAASTITVPAGQTTSTTTLTAIQDTTSEVNETIIVDISAVTGGDAVEDRSQQETVTITDDDNTIPTLTSFSAPVDSGNEDTAVEITFAELNAQGNEADSDGSVAGYVVKAVSSGSLSINGSAFATGTNDQITASKSASWTPASNANGTLTAFTVAALDNGGAQSASAVAVQVTVNAVNDLPTLTAFAAAVDSTDEDTTVEVTFAELLARGDEADVDGAVNAFVVKAVSTGALTIDGSDFAVGSNDQITASKKANWTPAANANGTLNAFTVVAVDSDAAESATAITAQVSVAAVNDTPSFTAFGSAVDSTSEDTAVAITFAELAAQGDESDIEGALAAFVVKAVASGTLTINGSAFATGTNDQITTTKSASWTPASNANGTLDAFTVVALDSDGAETATAVTAQVTVSAVNDIPTLTAFADVIDSSNEDTAVQISAADLAAQGDEADADGTVTAWIVKSVSSGSLTIGGSAFAPGTQDQINGRTTASWTPASNANGTQNAFTVVALDDSGGESTTPITVQVSVIAVNDAPTLTAFTAAVDTTNEDTAVEITFAELTAQGDEADPEGALGAFVVKAVSSGSLTINGTDFAAGTNDQITTTKSANWTPASNTNGTLDAFTVVALDGDDSESATAITAQVSVTAINDAPVLATNAGLSLVTGSSGIISSDKLNEGDPDDSGTGLTYTVTTAPTLGKLELTTNVGVMINSFSQDDIDNNRVQYASNAGSGRDSFDFTLADGGEDGAASVAGSFSITVNDPPSESANEITSTQQNSGVINNPVITPTGILVNGNVSGAVRNQGILRNVTVNGNATVTGGTLQGTTTNQGIVTDVTVAEDARIEGGTVQGTINNAGRISNVKLGSGASIIGGMLSGQIIGNPDNRALVQSTIGPDGFVDNIVIGSNSLVDSRATLGANVLFESSSTIPAGIGLTRLFSPIPWSADPESVQTLNLQDTIFSEAGEEQGISLIRSIELLDEVGPAGISPSQNMNTGEFVLSGLDFNSTLLPVSVQQADSNAEQGMRITEDGDIAIVTTTNQQLTVYPALNDEAAMRDSLGDLTLDFDDRANLVIGLPDSAVTFMARPDLMATPAPQGAVPGLEITNRQLPANTLALTLFYEDDNGQLLQQSVPPVPANWMELKETLTNTSGVENVRIGGDGVIQLSVNGVQVSAIAEYEVTQVPAPDEPGDLVLTAGGDRNGDGIEDVVMIFPDGRVQALYLLP